MQSTWRSAALAWQSSRACGLHPRACSRAHLGLFAGFSRSFSTAVPAAAAAAAEVVPPSVRGNVVRRLYERYPNLAPMLSGICLYVASDLLAASGEASYTSSSETRDEHPMSQLSRTLGVMAAAPIQLTGLLAFYRWIDRLVGPRNDSFVRHVLPKICLDMVVWTPSSVCMYMYLTTVFRMQFENLLVTDLQEKRSTLAERHDQGFRKVTSNFWESYSASWLVWPLSDAINFTIVARYFSPHFRATWDAGMGLLWNTYMSIITFRKDEQFGKLF